MQKIVTRAEICWIAYMHICTHFISIVSLLCGIYMCLFCFQLYGKQHTQTQMVYKVLEQEVYIDIKKERASMKARGGVLNFGLGRGVPLGFLKCHPSMYPFWRKSDPSMYQKSKFFAEICAILAQISENFKKLTNQSTKFAPFWSKF